MIRRYLSALALVILVGLASPGTALAKQNPLYQGVDCSANGAASSAVCQDDTGEDPITGENGVLMHATDIVAYVAGAAAIVIIVISGIRFITSGGDSNKSSTARGTLQNAIIGLLVVVLAKSMINFVLNRI